MFQCESLILSIDQIKNYFLLYIFSKKYGIINKPRELKQSQNRLSLQAEPLTIKRKISG